MDSDSIPNQEKIPDFLELSSSLESEKEENNNLFINNNREDWDENSRDDNDNKSIINVNEENESINIINYCILILKENIMAMIQKI